MLEALLFGLATIVLGIILMGIGFFGSDMGMAFTDAFNFIVSLKWLTVPLAGILTVVLWAVILFLICLPQLVLAGWKTKRYAEKAPEHLKRECSSPPSNARSCRPSTYTCWTTRCPRLYWA